VGPGSTTLMWLKLRGGGWRWSVAEHMFAPRRHKCSLSADDKHWTGRKHLEIDVGPDSTKVQNCVLLAELQEQ